MICRYTIKSVRREVSPYVPATRREDGTWTYGTPAVYDFPHRAHTEVVADFRAGRPTPGDEVSVEVLGAGTTVAVEGRTVSRGWDDHEWCIYATYRTPDGAWAEVWVSTENRDGNHAEVDAPAEVTEAWKAHQEAEYQRRLAEEAARREQERLEREARERAEVNRGRFVVVARGRKVPVGTVGRVFHLAASEWGERAGLATSTRTEQRMNGRGYVVDAAVDVAWCSVSNLDVLLEELPAAPAEVELLYRCAAAVCDHARARLYAAQKAAHEAALAGGPWASEPDANAPVVDVFTALWRWAVEQPERIAVMLAYGPSELPRRDAETPRTLEEVCEAVETMPDVAGRLGRIPREWRGLEATDAERAAIRAEVVAALGVVWVPPAKATRKARAPRKAKAGATEAA